MHAALVGNAVLLALDWGTSSLRAYAMDAGGAVLATRRSEHGVMNLPVRPDIGSATEAFEAALQALCGDWLAAQPDTPVIACGMVGSAQGWREARYQSLPARVSELAKAMTAIERPGGPPLHVVPGLLQAGELPNVMRGEETQIAGVLQSLADEGQAPPRLVVGLPGSHTKWAWIEGGAVVRFETFMTGEIYAALSQHTILSRTMVTGSPHDEPSFARGLRVARSALGAMGVLSTVFSVRTLGLTGQLAGSAQPDYLSGLLIGHEVAAIAPTLQDGTLVVLCGEPLLCLRYSTALEAQGLPAPEIRSGVTPLGLWRIALAAGLVFPSPVSLPE
jgi:2-dehydro-3-deoxygalactonokinase